jgi:hypothetical protein
MDERGVALPAALARGPARMNTISHSRAEDPSTTSDRFHFVLPEMEDEQRISENLN